MALVERAIDQGQLVQLSGLPEPFDLEEVLHPEGLKAEQVRANGQAGKVVERDHRSGKYVVETFNGRRILVAGQNITPYNRPELGQGGFHAVWPHGVEESAEFSAEVAGQLASEDFCVIQLFSQEENFAQVLADGRSPLTKYQGMKKELEPSYLGQQAACKAAWLDTLAEDKPETISALDECDLILSQFTRFMVPLSPVVFHFMPYSRTNGLVRMPYQSASEANRLHPQEVDDDDIADGLLDEHVQFVKRRQLCMMLVCSSEGADMLLLPKSPDRTPISLTPRQGQLIVFRHDRMSYGYKARSINDVVLQAWMMTEPDNLDNLTLETDNQAYKDEAIGLLTGPKTPEGMNIDALGLGVMLPAGADSSPSAYWAAVLAGTDGVTKVPYNRYDMDPYVATGDEWKPGYTYTVHGGHVVANIFGLDTDFFKIPEQEGWIVAPAQKCVLEKGYEAFYRSGHTRATLNGSHVGVFIGHSGDDWGTPFYTVGGEDHHKSGYKSRIWSAISGRISHQFGLKGPQSVIDTACSSSLVAYGTGHTQLRAIATDQAQTSTTKLTEALMCGANIMPGPANYINLCGPHMLSIKGRCFTFDYGADGFTRGEGAGAFMVRSQPRRTDDSTCTMIGACLNQDGRSASMTAPNGPAQQACIRASMKEARLSASEVTCAELHGTGTALGDPIEVGSLKGVMQDRGVPLMQSSAKTHLGHLEAGAGLAGVMKCMLMCAACAGSPNCHLVSLNPHLDISGYPTVIATEVSDFGASAGYSGVSSFGFGGANARADVFAVARKGAHAVGAVNLEKLDYITIQCPFDEGPMHYLDGKAVPLTTSSRYVHGPYKVNAIRGEFDSYDGNTDLYKGSYQIHPPDEDIPDPPSEPIYVVGSWDQFTEPIKMSDESEGMFTAVVTLGETRCETFQLRVDKDPARAIFPVAPNGSMRTRCVGPDASGQGLYWRLDGRDKEIPAGTKFKITLRWGERQTVAWEPCSGEEETEASAVVGVIAKRPFHHVYSVIGSWTSWQHETMQDMSTRQKPCTWLARFKMGLFGKEFFRFSRDFDDGQMIYPLRDKAEPREQACGPDEHCCERSWEISGKPGEIVTVQLQVVDGHVTVTASSPSVSKMVAESIEGPLRHSYQIAGTFNDLQYVDMSADPEEPGVFKYRGMVGLSGTEHFSISVDGHPDLTYCPENPGAYPGESIVRGPMRASKDCAFSVFSLKPGAEFEIVLNLHASDSRKIVDVRWLSDRYDHASMQAVSYEYLSMMAN